MSASVNFTHQSASASDIQSGAIGPMPISGIASFAQATSFAGSRKVKAVAKAIEKKIEVSRIEPKSVEISGAFHHCAARSRSKIVTSSICAHRKARPEASATRNSALQSMVEWLWTLRESSEISRLFAEKIRRQVAGPNIQAHEKIYQCLSRRDAAGARAAMQEHIAQVTEAYILLIAD